MPVFPSDSLYPSNEIIPNMKYSYNRFEFDEVFSIIKIQDKNSTSKSGPTVYTIDGGNTNNSIRSIRYD